MRILAINYEYPPLGGGAGNATANISREMARQGAEVLVLTSAFRGFPARERADGFEIRRIPTIRRHEEKCAPWEMAAFMASACLHAPLMARRFRPDAVLAYFGIPCGPPAWLVKAFGGTPYVVSLRGGDVPGFQPYDLAAMHRLTGPLIRLLWRKAGAVVANSGGLAALARRFEPGLEYPVIPNGADTALFHPRSGERAPGPVRLFFHGRLVYQKGLDILLAALGDMAAAPFELHLAGDGPMRPELEQQASSLGIRDKIFFHGWMRRPELARALRGADLFVFPSRDEGMPNAVLEAMASGLPVVASAIAGSEELVLPGLTGRLVPPEDAPALAAALAPLLTDIPLLETMGAAGRERVERHYSWASAASRYLELCARLAGGHR
ncbi:glycosyltransferase family 4 protein [Fundidesulfovibrio agrisoli]|uniref:glycosyltransferase family 4 protein n=1 Tax=Fundidesulfovibrio agrisoli TaxID=2922717 RepID=UPI001FABA2FA|nr:glycosyltransferase family 4 protein [Fundidesulfovibrio agrisoli]